MNAAFVEEVRLTGLAALRALTSFYAGHDLTYASSIAYYALLSLFPLLLLLLAVLASVTADAADRAAVLDFVFRYFPRQGDFARGQLEALVRSRGTLGVAGSLLVVWAALGFFAAINAAVNEAWGVEKRRSFFMNRLVSFSMLLAAGGLLAAALVLVSVIGLVESEVPWVASIVEQLPWLTLVTGILFRYGATFLLILVVGLIYYFVPNAPVRFRDVWVGAILTGLLWRTAVGAFSWYLRDLSRLSSIHGSVTTVVVFLVWVYMSAAILLLGVEFTAAHARLRRVRARLESPSPR